MNPMNDSGKKLTAEQRKSQRELANAITAKIQAGMVPLQITNRSEAKDRSTMEDLLFQFKAQADISIDGEKYMLVIEYADAEGMLKKLKKSPQGNAMMDMLGQLGMASEMQASGGVCVIQSDDGAWQQAITDETAVETIVAAVEEWSATRKPQREAAFKRWLEQPNTHVS